MQTTGHGACGQTLPNTHLVHSGPHRATVGHRSGTISAQDLPSITNRLDGYGTFQCRRFRAQIFKAHPQLASGFAHIYEDIAKTKGYVVANQNLSALDARLKIRDFNCSSDSVQLKRFADYQASRCRHFAARYGYVLKSYQLCSQLAERYTLEPPTPKEQGVFSPCIRRMESERWWRKKLFTLQRRTIEAVARDIGLVSQYAAPYSSMISQSIRQDQKSRNDHYLSNTFIQNDEGQKYSLKELAELSVSNPAIRRGELMTRIKGFEMVAEHLGHIGEFYTLTAPSKMHARFKRNGKANPKYDGTTPIEAHQHLNQLFQCIRAKLHREGIFVYGIRVVEPNHDGTPHWHLLLFMPEQHRRTVRQIFSEYSLKEDGQERGASKHRFKAVGIDREKGSAAGYIAKYIAKNIDGAHIDYDLDGSDSKAAAAAIDSWASTWGIRQFQFIGGPSVTVWRELRRLASPHSDLLKNAKPDDSALMQAMIAADASEWAAYVMVMGGPILRKKDRPIQPLYSETECVDEETGELFEDNLGAYGDPIASRVIGLQSDGHQFISRFRKWTLIGSDSLEREGRTSEARATESEQQAGFANELRRDANGIGAADPTRLPWTRVNNCTRVQANEITI
ncbi:replication endonuclease [Motiliproteus coralliicola]|uniref:Replication endonuclease n=1 Tax=Motiliproteus coralliicola TaxID=2283196 RepID=A0A369WI99_9GAMM|nr:replication endonuclease [Motiliproteus coralliicola]